MIVLFKNKTGHSVESVLRVGQTGFSKLYLFWHSVPPEQKSGPPRTKIRSPPNRERIDFGRPFNADNGSMASKYIEISICFDLERSDHL